MAIETAMRTLILASCLVAVFSFQLNFDFLQEDIKDCDPVERLLKDPRADGMRQMLESEGLTQMYKDVWAVSGGTVFVPTTDAWESLLASVGADFGNASEVVSPEAWRRIIPSYFLSNVTYLPKDVYNMVYQTPNGFLMMVQPFTDNPDDADAPVSLVIRYTDINAIAVPGQGSVANLTAFGTPARVSDYSTVCSLYAVYWVDTMPHPFKDACALTYDGCEDPQVLNIFERVGDMLTPAPAPGQDDEMSSSSSDEEDEKKEGGSRRLRRRLLESIHQRSELQ